MRTVTPEWIKSSYSGSDGDNCVEVAALAACVHVRDSKDVGGGQLVLSLAAWSSFVGHAARAQV